MNIHPMFVHFPVALFLVYALLEICRFTFITNKPYYFYTKGIIVVLGAVSAFAALLTGEPAEHAYKGPLSRLEAHKIIELHSTIAGLTTVVFVIIALLYVIGYVR